MSWRNLFVPRSLVLLVPLLAPCSVGGQPLARLHPEKVHLEKHDPGKLHAVGERRLPDLTVTSFALTAPASKTFGFLEGPKSYPGYIFVPVQLTVTNIGGANTGSFKVGARCRLLGATVRPAGFMGYKGTQDVVGGGSAGFAAAGVSFKVWSAHPGLDPVGVAPLPPGGKVTITSILNVPVGSMRENVALWIVADCNNQVVESNKNNNKSQEINCPVPGTFPPVHGHHREQSRWEEDLKAIKELKVQLQPGADSATHPVAVDVKPIEHLLHNPPGRVEVSLRSQGKTVARLGSFEPGGKGGWTTKPSHGHLVPLPLAQGDLQRLRTKGPKGGIVLCISGLNEVESIIPLTGDFIQAVMEGEAERQYNLQKVNDYRAKAKVPPLKLDPQLTQFAHDGSVQLSKDHKPHQHFKDNPQGFGSHGEIQGSQNGWPIVGWPNKPDVKATIDQILASMMAEPYPPPPNANGSPGYNHHSIIIDPNYTKLGVGLFVDKVKGLLYFTNDFNS